MVNTGSDCIKIVLSLVIGKEVSDQLVEEFKRKFPIPNNIRTTICTTSSLSYILEDSTNIDIQIEKINDNEVKVIFRKYKPPVKGEIKTEEYTMRVQ